MPTTTKDFVALFWDASFVTLFVFLYFFCPQRYFNKKRQNLKPEGVYPDKDEKHYQMLIRPLKSFSRGLLLEMAWGKDRNKTLKQSPLTLKKLLLTSFFDQNYKDRQFISEEVLKLIMPKVQWHREHIYLITRYHQ